VGGCATRRRRLGGAGAADLVARWGNGRARSDRAVCARWHGVHLGAGAARPCSCRSLPEAAKGLALGSAARGRGAARWTVGPRSEHPPPGVALRPTAAGWRDAYRGGDRADDPAAHLLVRPRTGALDAHRAPARRARDPDRPDRPIPGGRRAGRGDVPGGRCPDILWVVGEYAVLSLSLAGGWRD